MRAHLRRALWVVFALALVETPALARAQPSDDVPDLPRLQELRVVEAPDLTPDTRRHDVLLRSVSAAFMIAASTDLSVSMYQIGRGNAREAGFGAQWQDSPVAFAVTKSAMAAAFAYGMQRMHKTRPKTALVLGVAATALEGWLTIRSARIATH